MKRLFIILPLCILASTMPATAQSPITQSFKPGPTVGEDAYLMELADSCIFYGQTQTQADIAHGNVQDLNMSAWTWTGQGCDSGLQRTIIRFTGLSSIPVAATIVSATLILKTPPTMPGYNNWLGNSFYSGSPFPTNPGFLKRIEPGSSSSTYWDEQNITWNQFQANFSTDPNSANWVTIPASTGQYNTTTTLDVTAIVQQIVNELANPYANNGFLLSLQNEVHYRGQSWASSDYPDSIYWPELIVTYKNCDPSFSYCANTADPYTYTFTATNPNQAIYNWYINGTLVSNASAMSYTFPGAGSYKVCLRTAGQSTHCDYCLVLCIADNQPSLRPAPQPEHTLQPSSSVPQQQISIPGDNLRQILKNQNIIITPNPTHTGWHIKLHAKQAGKIVISIFDITGKKLKTSDYQLAKGEQTFYENAATLAKGTYIIAIQGAGLNVRKKVVKY